MHHASLILVRGVTTRPDRRVDSRLRGNDGIGGLPDFFSSLLVDAKAFLRRGDEGVKKERQDAPQKRRLETAGSDANSSLNPTKSGSPKIFDSPPSGADHVGRSTISRKRWRSDPESSSNRAPPPCVRFSDSARASKTGSRVSSVFSLAIQPPARSCAASGARCCRATRLPRLAARHGRDRQKTCRGRAAAVRVGG